ncbi:pre-RNA processing PIH1/Nop17 domain-containing protein [Ditylenchus destructor]|nr:pre-RNA processing PIH1/Nop17 domain-containing protein [Ditylenchus destructor]
MRGSKRLITEVNRDDEDVWTVYPVPGFVVKFKDARFTNTSQMIAEKSTSSDVSSGVKFFLNIAHCAELPPPKQDLEEDEVVHLMATANNFKIPLSIGEIDRITDKQGEEVQKVDVLVNSTFFHKRVQLSEFFRQLTITTVCDLIESRHGIHLDPINQIILRNKKAMGELNSQRIRKKPTESLKPSTQSNKNSSTSKSGLSSNGPGIEIVENMAGGSVEEEGAMDVDTVESLEEASSSANKPRNYRVQILNGRTADIRIRARDESEELVQDPKRLTLKMNEDRCVLIVDGSRTVTDIYLPYKLVDAEAECTFSSSNATLIIKCPINWN